MDFILWLAIIGIVIGYLNLALMLFRERPVINIYNKLPEEKSSQSLPADRTAEYSINTGTGEIPIESHITVKDFKGDINLDSEIIGSSNVSELTDKIKNIRSK